MTLLKRLLWWRTAKSGPQETRAAETHAGEDPQADAAEAKQEVMDAGLGLGFTPDPPDQH